MTRPNDDRGIRRRTIAKAVAWTGPVLVTVGAAPAYAASPNVNVGVAVSAPTTISAGSTAPVTFTVTNTGTKATSGPTTLNIPKPSVGTLTLGTLPSGWTATETSNGWIVTTSVALPAGYTAQIPLTYAAPALASTNSTVTFSGTLTATGGEGAANGSNNTASQTTTVTPVAITNDLYSEPRTPQPNNRAAKTVLYRWGNYGPQKTTEDAVWTVTITQTAGPTDTRYLRIESIDADWRNRTSVSFVDSVNAAGYKVTTYTITLLSGFPAATWVRSRIDFPGAVVGSERWTIESVAQFTDTNNGNNNFTDYE